MPRVMGGAGAPFFVLAVPVIFVIIWSSGFIVAKLAFPYAPPLTFLAWRYAFAVALLLPLIALSRSAWPVSGTQAMHLAVAGVLVHVCYLGGVWVAISRGMPAGLTALIVGLQPVLTAFAGPWLGERVGAKQWAGLLLGFAGVGLVVANNMTLSGLSVPAVLLCVFALLGITAGTIYQKRFCPSFDLRTGAFVQYATSFLVTLPFALLLEEGRVEWVIQTYFALGWSVFAISIGAMFLLFLMIRHGAATRVASLFYLTPPTTALMAWLFFDEALSVVAMIGMVLAVLGVALVAGRPASNADGEALRN